MSLLTLQHNNVSCWGKGQANLVSTRKDWGSLSMGFFSVIQPVVCAAITWSSSPFSMEIGELVKMLILLLLLLL